MILVYKGADEYLAPNFIAIKGDKVKFTDEMAQEKLTNEPDLWEVLVDGTSRKSGGSLRSK